jgi:hypothetical protein
MDKSKLRELYQYYELQPSDVFKHQHYVILTRQAIDKIIAKEQLDIRYEVIKCEPEYCCFKAIMEKDGKHLETFGSAKYGDFKNGNSQSWYIAEMAEKRAKSRITLMSTGFYELGVFGEDESESFKKNG